jgi:hypothetical protein
MINIRPKGRGSSALSVRPIAPRSRRWASHPGALHPLYAAAGQLVLRRQCAAGLAADRAELAGLRIVAELLLSASDATAIKTQMQNMLQLVRSTSHLTN